MVMCICETNIKTNVNNYIIEQFDTIDEAKEFVRHRFNIMCLKDKEKIRIGLYTIKDDELEQEIFYIEKGEENV